MARNILPYKTSSVDKITDYLYHTNLWLKSASAKATPAATVPMPLLPVVCYIHNDSDGR